MIVPYQYFTALCEWKSENMHDFVKHMHDTHTLVHTKLDFKCHYCAEMFQTKSELMAHRKLAHEEKVPISVKKKMISKNPAGLVKTYQRTKNCQNSNAIYVISKNLAGLLTTYQRTKNCQIQMQYIYDKDCFHEHSKFVEMCRHEKDGICQHDLEKCWFNHMDENINEDTPKDKKDIRFENQQEIMQKLFDMIEKQTEKIIFLENQLKD
jgi:hypothetical protein